MGPPIWAAPMRGNVRPSGGNRCLPQSTPFRTSRQGQSTSTTLSPGDSFTGEAPEACPGLTLEALPLLRPRSGLGAWWAVPRGAVRRRSQPRGDLTLTCLVSCASMTPASMSSWAAGTVRRLGPSQRRDAWGHRSPRGVGPGGRRHLGSLESRGQIRACARARECGRRAVLPDGGRESPFPEGAANGE